LIAPTLAVLLFRQTAPATGIEDPLRWTEQAETPQILNSPEFYFELEVKRLAAELKPVAKAVPPNFQDGGDYNKQTIDADLGDFVAAVEGKAIQPPDIEKAKAAHQEMRELLGAVVRVDQEEANNLQSEDFIKPLKPSKEAIEEPVAPEEYASEFADYHRGALSFRCGHREKAVERWKALLERPATDRKYRTTWALFMLGKAAIEAGDWGEAIGWFVKTREAAVEGFVDSIGLASSSLGWQAFAHEENEQWSDAARLYLDQLASGDTTAIRSLRYLMQSVFTEDANLDQLIRDPILQRLGTAGAVSQMTPFPIYYSDNDQSDDLVTKWLAALEKAQVKNVRDADRVAWIAYTRGNYDKAARWLERAEADAAYSLWLKAKLALRAGKLDVAAKSLSRALEKLPATKMMESRSLVSITEIPPEIAAGGDLGMLRLGRGEFVAAFRTFMDAGHFNDASYVADAVLSIEELKQFIDSELDTWEKARTVKKRASYGEIDPNTGAEKPPELKDVLQIGWEEHWDRPGPWLRNILASRYVRAGRYAEARPYFEESMQGVLDDYVAALDLAAKSNASKSDRAAAYWKAANIMHEDGQTLADYYDPISIAGRLSGKVIETGPLPVIAMKYTDRDEFVPPVTKSEKERLKKHSVPAIRRYYSIYLSADLGWRAAALMPDNDEQTARILNQAGNWLKARDDGAADRFYQAIERRCAKTDLGKEAIKRRWFVPVEEQANDQN
jgi:tetratricopeptide (TPR) repeat protein